MPRTDLPDEAHAYLRRLDEALIELPRRTRRDPRRHRGGVRWSGSDGRPGADRATR